MQAAQQLQQRHCNWPLHQAIGHCIRQLAVASGNWLLHHLQVQLGGGDFLGAGRAGVIEQLFHGLGFGVWGLGFRV